MSADTENKLEMNKPTSLNIKNNRLGGILSKYGTVLLLVGLIILFSILTPAFMTAANWTNILVVQVVVASLTLGVLMPLIMGEFDLSIGYMVGFISMLGAVLAELQLSAFIIIFIMICSGLLIGLINGVLTVYFKISSFIATLGSGIILSGLTLGLSGGEVKYEGVPNIILSIGQNYFLGISISVWFVGILAVILFYVLEHTPLGRFLYAIGGQEKVAFLAGIKTKSIKILAFVVAGLFVSMGALFQLGQAGAANPSFGPELLLPAYAGVFLGVTTYRPGYYNVVGSIIAVLLLAVGFNGLSLLGAPFWVQPIFNGTVLLIAILTARSEARKVKIDI